MSITLQEFAREVGLSPVTVSRAMNNSPSVRSKTRDKILAKARELGYRADPAARALAGGQQFRHVGVLAVTDRYTSSPLRTFSRLISILLEKFEEHGRSVMLAGAFEDKVDTPAEKRKRPLPRMLDEKHIGHVVILCEMYPELAEEIRQIHKLGIEAINVNFPSSEIPAIVRDEEQAAELMVDYLAGLGHRRIAFVNHGPPGPESFHRDFLWPRGYLKAITRHQLVPVPGWDLFEHLNDAVERLLSLPERPTAIIAYDDDEAARLIYLLKNRGLSVPKDISVANLHDNGFSARHLPNLTHVPFPNEEVAAALVEWVVHGKETLKLDERQRLVIPSPGIFEGGSCGRLNG